MSKQPLTAGQIARGAFEVARFIHAITPPPPPELPTPPPPVPVDPMAGFATRQELGRYAMRTGAFFLGRIHEDHGVNFYAGIDDDRHLILEAGTRAGKDRSISIPNALLWPGPVFMIDPKGDGASICAMRRAHPDAARGTGTSVRSFIGQKVAVLDPLGQVRGPSRVFRVNYNPLADIDMRASGGVRAIRAMASSIITPEEGNGAHFSENAETLVAGVIEAVKLREPVYRQSLPQCRSLMVAGFDALRKYLMAVDTPAGLAQEAATLMTEVGDNEWGSFRSTLSRNLKWLADPDMQAHLAPSAFSLRRAVQEGWSVFTSLPPEEIAEYRGWLRVIVRTMLGAKIALGTNQKGPRTLCLLDEFPTLGRFKIIEESAGYMAGYGVKLVPVIQTIGQLQNLYGKNWETFCGNAGAFITFGMNNLTSESYVSDRLGKTWVNESTGSINSGTSSQFMGSGSSMSMSSNIARHARPVRFANDIRVEGARETMRAFVIPASGRGFTIRRLNYDEYPSGTFDHPDFITAWERTYWRG